MNEAEWNTSQEPERMVRALLAYPWQGTLKWLLGKRGIPRGNASVSPRKLRLFACACCRPLFEIVIDSRCLNAIETAERFAEGQASDEQLQEARVAVAQAMDALAPSTIERASPAFGMGASVTALWQSAARAVAAVILADASDAAREVQLAVERACIEWSTHGKPIREIANEIGAAARARLLRDIFGPRPTTPPSLEWVSPTALEIAQAIYTSSTGPRGEFDSASLAVLADALEETGCTDAAILDHCRNPGIHVRGCWVIDLLLEKT